MKRYKNRNIGNVMELTSNSEYGIPVANMDKIAIKAGITHKSMNRLINNNKKHLMQSGSVRFENEAGSSHKKIYKLNSAQCAFIVEKMHSNGSNDLKKQIANVFTNQIRNQLERQAVHQISKDAVKSFSNAIKDNLDSPNGYMYMNFTNLAYKYALGVGVKKIQALRGAKGTSNKKDYLSSYEIELLSKAMTTIEALLNIGMNYDEIKHHLSNHCLNKAKITVKLGGVVHE